MAPEHNQLDRYFAVAFGGGPVPMTLTEVSDTADRVILDANDAMANLLGYSIDELRGMSFVDITHPGDLADDDAGTDAQTSGSSDVFTARKRYIRADGSTVWVQLHVAVLEKTDDRIVTVGHCIDITSEVTVAAAAHRRQLLSNAVSEIRSQQLAHPSADAGQRSFAMAAREAVGAAAALMFRVSDGGHGRVCDLVDVINVPESVRGAFRGVSRLVSEVASTGDQPRYEATSDSQLWAEAEAEFPGSVLALSCASTATSQHVLCLLGPNVSGLDDDATRDLVEYAELVEIAVELSKSRQDAERVALFEDRERIARDIHDRVIGRLFATGMSLQAGLAGNPDESAMRQKIELSVGEIDEAIKDIRDAIYSS